MFRQIAHLFDGKRKAEDDSEDQVDFSAVQEFVERLEEDEDWTLTPLQITVYYASHGVRVSLKGKSPNEVLDFVRKEFQPSEREYFEAEHQIFMGKLDNRHYIDLRRGAIETTVGTEEVRLKPHTKATLDFVIQGPRYL